MNRNQRKLFKGNGNGCKGGVTKMIEAYFEKSCIPISKAKNTTGQFVFEGIVRERPKRGDSKMVSFSVVVDDNDVYGSSVVPFTVPKNKRTEVSELITRINCRLRHGRFDQDFETGAVRFRCSQAIGAVQLGIKKGVCRVCELPPRMTLDWVDEIKVVAIDGKRPEEVFKRKIRKLITNR